MILNATLKLAAARSLIRKRAPYFAHALLCLTPREMPGLGTLATTDTGILLYDPEAVAKWTVPQLAGVLVHEIHHWILNHHVRFKGMDQMIGNIAMDIAINPAIVRSGFELPDPILPSTFMLPEEKTSEWYYLELLKKAKKQGGSGGSDKTGVTRGWCGSCAGRPVPNEPGTEDPAARSPTEIARAQRAVAEAVRQHAKSAAGTIPGDLLRWAEVQARAPKVRWQDKLARAARRSVAHAAGMQDYTFSRPSRRSLAGSAGDPIRPSMCRTVPNVLVAIDTSGSMGPDELSTAVAETAGVFRAVGTEIEVLSCDTTVHAKGIVRNPKAIKDLLRGGGGTSFHPIFDEVARKHRDIVIVITDGMGPAPILPPHGAHVIWLLIGRGARSPVSWGESLLVD